MTTPGGRAGRGKVSVTKQNNQMLAFCLSYDRRETCNNSSSTFTLASRLIPKFPFGCIPLLVCTIRKPSRRKGRLCFYDQTCTRRSHAIVPYRNECAWRYDIVRRPRRYVYKCHVPAAMYCPDRVLHFTRLFMCLEHLSKIQHRFLDLRMAKDPTCKQHQTSPPHRP